MNSLKAFIAGFASTLIFHQGVLALLHAADASVPAPFSMAATAPLQVPAVISLAFWGGVWAVLLWPLIRANGGWGSWVFAAGRAALGSVICAPRGGCPAKGEPVGRGW